MFFQSQYPPSFRQSSSRSLVVTAASAILALGAATGSVAAQDYYVVDEPEKAEPVAPPAPAATMTLISLNKQRMYVYDQNGFVTTSRVSTGSRGYDTPKGIYSIIQKKADHASNIYEGAPMPHMQRLLWTGIALHGGQVPRYAASHGCVRLPFDFAETFFGMTTLNHRVVITPDVQEPVAFSHPLLFSPLPGALPQVDTAAVVGPVVPDDTMVEAGRRAEIKAERAKTKARLFEDDRLAKVELDKARDAEATANDAIAAAKDQLKAVRDDERAAQIAAAKAVRASAAAEKDRAAVSKRIASKGQRMRADALVDLQRTEAELRTIAEKAARDASAAAAQANSVKAGIADAQRAVAEAVSRAAAAKKQLAVMTQNEAATVKAIEDFQLAERNRSKPVSVFVSARTGVVSVRQGFEPVAEGLADIKNPNAPLGTFVFTATGWADDARTGLNWTALGVDETGELDSPRILNSDASNRPPPTDARRAKMALDRIKLPPHIVEIVAEVVKPGSSLIVSDYDMAKSEVGKGTDFIVQMPEVVAKFRNPEDVARAKEQRYASRYGYSYYAYGRGIYPPPPPPKFWKYTQQKPKKYRPMRSIFAYGEYRDDDDD